MLQLCTPAPALRRLEVAFKVQVSTRALPRKSELKSISLKKYLTPPLGRCPKLKNAFETTYIVRASISAMAAPRCSITQPTKQRLPKSKLSSKNSLLREDRRQMLASQVEMQLTTLSKWTNSIRLWVSSTTTQTAKSMPLPPVA